MRFLIDSLESSTRVKTILVVILALFLLLSRPLGLAAQASGVERAGDVLQVAIPTLAFAGTIAFRDSEGTAQFLRSFLANIAATGALKGAIARERPDGSNDNSFPSGHTSAAFQGASFIHLRYGWARGLPAYAGATFVGFSRVYADKHYVSDVVAGAAPRNPELTPLHGSVRLRGGHPATDGGRFGVEMRLVVGF